MFGQLNFWGAVLALVNRLPSWVVELLSGIVSVGLALGLLALLGLLVPEAHLMRFTFPFALLLGEVYEHTLDRNGYNAQDVVERVRGVAFMMVLAILFR